MSRIAIDYDQTYSEFRDEIDVFVKALKKKGHKVMLVTARNKDVDPIHKDVSIFDEVIYTAGKAKASVVRADLWLDDNPITLACDFVPGEPAATPGKALHQGYKDKHILWNFEEGKFVTYVANPWSPDELIAKE